MRPHFRLIPAHAGKTAPPRAVIAYNWAHPRSRGENDVGDRADRLGVGSSPLTRGKPDPHPHSGHSLGLIPAHAGKTGFEAGDDFASGAHPRSRGENLRVGVDALKAQGSSPLTRGKRSLMDSAL